jgi:hypothetical protein
MAAAEASRWDSRPERVLVAGDDGEPRRAAAEENFFLRGFNCLLVFKKERRRAAGDGR